jgi:hypothetical protein
VNQQLLDLLNPEEVEVVIRLAGETEAEADEMWSFVKRKNNQRWLWHAIDHHSGKVLAYVFGRRQDEAFLKLKALLEPFGITKYRLSKNALSRAFLVPGIWLLPTLYHCSISRPIDGVFRIGFVISGRPKITTLLTAFPRTAVLVLIVRIAHTEAFMLHLAPSTPSER